MFVVKILLAKYLLPMESLFISFLNEPIWKEYVGCSHEKFAIFSLPMPNSSLFSLILSCDIVLWGIYLIVFCCELYLMTSYWIPRHVAHYIGRGCLKYSTEHKYIESFRGQWSTTTTQPSHQKNKTTLSKL